MPEYTPTRKEMIVLREQGMTREDIAEHFDVGITTVRRWIKLLEIPRPTKQARNKRESNISRIGEIIVPMRSEMTVLEEAIEILGDRFEDRRHVGYFLDGRPTSADKIVQAAGVNHGRR